MREVAWRVFAGEYNDSTHEVTEGDERSPSYVVTPLGAKINRLFVVGVLTDIENVGTEAQPMWRARISDPTGTFHLYAGQYQPDASATLSKMKPPAFVAVTGKSRTYKPESGGVYTSIRPEGVKVVDAALRDYWILEACRGMRKRIDATREAQGIDPITKEQLVALGYGGALAEGVVAAVQAYGKVDVSRYSAMLLESLRYLLPEYQEAREATSSAGDAKDAGSEAESPEELEREERVLDLVSELDRDGKGAPWDALLDAAKERGIPKETLEEVTNDLLDKGVLYEPLLGRMKRI